MSYSAKILADSISPAGVRLTTMEVTFPRIVLAEFNTHRMFSRNSASSRAIPVEKMLARVMDDPFLPVWWGKNQSGMQANDELSDEIQHSDDGHSSAPSDRETARKHWLWARDFAVERVRSLQVIGLHKQIANRLLEPFLWHTVIVTATEWENFFALRCHKDAQPEIRVIAAMMRGLYAEGKTREVGYDDWHLPLVEGVDKEELIADVVDRPDQPRDEVNNVLAQVSSGRCARVSYLTHDGKRDWRADVTLAERLRASGHMSPFEHAARPMRAGDPSKVFEGNFRGWVQYRKLLPHEAIYSPV